MFDYFYGIMLTALEMICCKMFFETFGERRSENTWKNRGIILGLMILVYSLALLFQEYVVVKQVAIVAVTTLLMILYLKIHLAKAVILSLLFQGLLLSVDYFAIWLNVSLFHSIEEIDETNSIGGNLVWILGKIILFLIVLVIKKKFGEKNTDVLRNTDWIRFIIFPIFTIFTIIALIITSENVINQRQESVFLGIALCMAGMNIIVFNLINDIMKREIKIRENKIFRIEVQNQTDMYRTISENFTKQRKKTHEYKNQIMCMKSLLAAKRYDELETYVQKVSGQLNEELDYIRTNNVIVDAILNSKYQEILDKNIVFIFKINDLSGINIDDEDVVVILSNLLNNAIEACEKCLDKRVMKMKFVKEQDSIIISVRNTYNGDLVIRDGEIQTSKIEHVDEHGVGIKNIINVVAKYQGSYVIQNNDTEFYFSIMIPN